MDVSEFVNDVRGAAEVIPPLARSEDKFRAIYDAFRAVDAESFQRELRELELLDRCELVCEWLCSKECVLVCLGFCGPPPEQLPEPREFAEVVVRLTSDEELVERLATSVAERDKDAFTSLIEEQKLERFCHLLCHWVCGIRCRHVCEIVCGPPRPQRPNLVKELVSTGQVLRRLLANEKAFASAIDASRRGNCEGLRRIIVEGGQGEFCRVICEWICSWRCIWLCLRFCRPFPLERVDLSLTEAFEFAKATARLAAEPVALERLATAIADQNADAFELVAKEFQLERFCIQLCHWICYRWCRLFCICVCPPPFYNPLFTRVGDFAIYTDITAGSGLTSTGIYGHGGPNFGFFGCLRLIGFCPKTSPVFVGVQMQYRFIYESPPGNKVPLVGNLICQAVVGTRLIPWWDGTAFPFTAQTILVKGSGATPDPTPPPSPPVLGVPWPGPPPHVIVPDADGWVAVDQNALDGGFLGALLGFDTNQAFPGGPPAPGVAAGNPVPSGNQKNGVDAAIIFEATRVGLPPGSPDFTNTLAKIHINNWDEVSLLNLLQFHTGGGTPCSPLTTDLDIEYTTDHELMADWSLHIATAAPITIPVLPSGVGPRGSAGTHHENIASWPSCSYAVQLTTKRSLTDGYFDDSDKTNQLTFCK